MAMGIRGGGLLGLCLCGLGSRGSWGQSRHAFFGLVTDLRCVPWRPAAFAPWFPGIAQASEIADGVAYG